MRSALISDIHGNLEALNAVLSDIDAQGVDAIHCLGDIIGYGADPSACIKTARKHCDTIIMGNHEFATLGLQSTAYYNQAAKSAIEWTRQQLSDEDLEVMSAFELDKLTDDFYLVHSSPFEPDVWHYILNPNDARNALAHMKARLAFFGHTHIPMVVTETATGQPRIRAGHDFHPDEEQRYLVNVGSVGQPRDNDPRACYVVFDHIEREVVYHRVSYDIAKTQSKMESADLPEVLIRRLAAGV